MTAESDDMPGRNTLGRVKGSFMTAVGGWRATTVGSGLGAALRPAAQAGAALLATLVVAAALLTLGGHSPVEASRALWQGAFGSWHRFASFTLVQATPLLLTGLAVAFAFKAGVWNIGAEGQLYAGALAGAAVAVSFPRADGGAWLWLLPTALLAAATAGALWAAIPAAMKTRLGVGEVITTLLMNFVALFLAQYLVQGPLQEARQVFNQTDEIPAAAALPPLLPGSRLHVGFLLGVVLAGAAWLYLTRTAGGFRLRAVGAAPRAAEASGRVAVQPTIWLAFLVSGALAGLAGWVQVAGVTGRMYQGLSPGWGYTAIAVALLARLNPAAVVLAAVVFGALSAGGGAMQRDAGVPEAWVRGTEALLILALLAVDRGLNAARTRRGRRGLRWRSDETPDGGGTAEGGAVTGEMPDRGWAAEGGAPDAGGTVKGETSDADGTPIGRGA